MRTEYLTGFKVLSTNDEAKNFRVEIQTSEDTYTDVWDFTTEERRHTWFGNDAVYLSKDNLKDWCKRNNVYFDLYWTKYGSK